MAVLFSDSFDRTTGPNDWGNSWSVYGDPTAYSCDGSVATLSSDSGFGEGMQHAFTATDEFDITIKLMDDIEGQVGLEVYNASNQGYGFYSRTWGSDYQVWYHWGSSISSGAFNFNQDTWYWFRMQYIGGTLRTRAWADGDTEPGTWHTEDDVTDYTAFNAIALTAWSDGSPSFDDLQVTDGASAASGQPTTKRFGGVEFFAGRGPAGAGIHQWARRIA